MNIGKVLRAKNLRRTAKLVGASGIVNGGDSAARTRDTLPARSNKSDRLKTVAKIAGMCRICPLL